jgi:hypothetical protein
LFGWTSPCGSNGSGASSGQGPAWLMAVFPVCHVAAGVGLTYYTFCGYLNRTTIDLSYDQLTIRHGPLPWLGNHTLNPLDIASIDLSEGMRSDSETSYNVSAVDHEGRLRVLLSNLPIAEAVYLSHTLREKLGMREISQEG